MGPDGSDQLSQALAEVFQAFGFGTAGWVAIDDAGAVAVSDQEKPFLREDAVGFCDCVEVDAEFQGETAEGWQGFAGFEDAFDCEDSQLVGELLVGGGCAGGVYPDLRGFGH